MPPDHLTPMDGTRDRRVIAVLGPTNTGKTHYAIERMLAHRTGVIGLPLRLLAREVYDRIVALRGPSVVALVTGEERIVPARAAFWVCTVEAMPVDLGPEFLAVDEIQLCADPDRGHVFTDRLLRARGLSETLFLGSDAMRARIASLIPGARFLHRDRFSQLSYTGARKISRMPPRSAIVGFSVDDVYAIAELIRRQKGGAAVVMGALSPRTRNAQVALYENGDVDHLVATDAIGMGLNLDIGHVAFSGLAKFDGRRHRHLAPNELAQIAGRAGRFTTPGTFGTTGEVPALEPEVVEAIENHRFAPIRKLQWRNARLEFGTCDALIASLEARPEHPDLQRAREADDLATLRALSALPEVASSLHSGPEVRLLWDVCQLPDFRKVALDEHAQLCARLFGFLRAGGQIPADWLAGQIERIDRTDGEIDTLSKRLAYIRTWTYVAQRKAWIADADHWREETRAIEDRLSDALHLRLTQRFVDRRTSVLMRRLKQKETLVAHVSATDEVTVEDQFIGRLEGFRFRLDPDADAAAAKTLRAAGLAALAPALSLRSDKFYNAPDTEIDVTEQGGLMWGEHAVGKLAAGADALSPQIVPFVDEDAAPEIAEKVRRRLGHWVDRKIAALFQPLIALRDDEALTGMARGIAFRLVEALGVLPRAEVANDVKGLDQDQRAGLRKHGVRFGQYTLFQPLVLKPAPTRLRLVLWSLAEGLETFPLSPPPGLVTMPAVSDAPPGYYPRAGYRLAGERAIRIDMLERLADMVRAADPRGGFEASPEMLSITGLSLEQFAKLMEGMGYQATQGTREKRKPQPVERLALPVRAPRLSQAADPSVPAAPNPPPQPDAPQPDAPQPDAPQPDAPQPDAPQPDPGPTPSEPDVPRETPADPPAPPEPDIPPNEFPGGVPGEAPPDAPPDAPIEFPSDPPAEAPTDIPVEMPPGPAETPTDIPTELPPQVASGAEPAPQARVHATDTPAAVAAGDAVAETVTDDAAAPAETEIFFTFSRASRPRPERANASRQAKAEPGRDRSGPAARHGKEGGNPRSAKPTRPNGPPSKRVASNEPVKMHARPPRAERPVDPDNPFAALMALKTRN